MVKNSFLKRAMADTGLPDVADKLTGQTAIVMGEKDVAPVAKILKAVRGGIQDRGAQDRRGRQGDSVDPDVEALAELPSREVLLSQLLGLLLSPATQLVRVLNEPASSLARLLKAKGEKMRRRQRCA